MLAVLRPLRSSILCKASSSRSVVKMVSSLRYPEPIVFPAAAQHKNTLIMLHGLGKCICEQSDRRWSHPLPAAAAYRPALRFPLPTRLSVPTGSAATPATTAILLASVPLMTAVRRASLPLRAAARVLPCRGLALPAVFTR